MGLAILSALLFAVASVFFLDFISRQFGYGSTGDWDFRSDTVKPDHGMQVRWVLIGGSTSYGLGLKEDQTWFSKILRLTEKITGRKPRGVNLARLGGHLEDHILSADRFLKRPILIQDWLEGDRPLGDQDFFDIGLRRIGYNRIILAPVINDTATIIFRSKYRALPAARRFLTVLGGKLGVSFRGLKGLLKAAESNTSFVDESLVPATRNRYIELITRFIEKIGPSKIILVGLPIKYNRADYEHCMTNPCKDPPELILSLVSAIELEREARQDLSRTYGTALCESSRIFDHVPLHQKEGYFMDSIHLNDAGTSQLAPTLANCLRSHISKP